MLFKNPFVRISDESYCVVPLMPYKAGQLLVPLIFGPAVILSLLQPFKKTASSSFLANLLLRLQELTAIK